MLKVRWAQFFFNGTNAMDLLRGSEKIHAIRIIDRETKLCEVLTSHFGNYDVIEEANKDGIVLMAV